MKSLIQIVQIICLFAIFFSCTSDKEVIIDRDTKGGYSLDKGYHCLIITPDGNEIYNDYFKKDSVEIRIQTQFGKQEQKLTTPNKTKTTITSTWGDKKVVESTYSVSKVVLLKYVHEVQKIYGYASKESVLKGNADFEWSSDSQTPTSLIQGDLDKLTYDRFMTAIKDIKTM